MTDQLFNKVAVFTDIHFGLKGDSRQHNIDCENFLYWFIDEAKKFGADTCLFLGDLHHNRSRVNVSTLNYTVSNLERLDAAFNDVYLITGNHDLYYRDKREINSFEFARSLPNTHIISDPFVEGDVALVPWMTKNEWKSIKKIKCKYMFGHFELPHFKMNEMVEMPDHGELSVKDLAGPELVFSGHFHKRQRQSNIIYMGNCFPHSFVDVGDLERGAMFLEWGEEPEFRAWPDAPSYHRIRLSDMLERPNEILLPNSYNRVELDVRINYELANYIRDTFVEEFDVRDIQLQPLIEGDEEYEFDNDLIFESVDAVVLNYLSEIDSNNIDNELLAQIYREL